MCGIAPTTAWIDKRSIEELKTRLKKIKDRQQATILEGKGFTGQHKLSKKVIVLLKKLGFKIIIIRVANSHGAIELRDVIRNEITTNTKNSPKK